MRKPVFRGPGETDWGLPPFASRHIWEELRTALAEVFHHLVVHGREVRRLRRRVAGLTGPVRVSIGSGRTVQDGWLGIDLRKGADVYRCDLRKRLPFQDGMVDALLAEHIVEHFPLDDIPAVLGEFHRVLRPGAPVRVVCPDAEIVFALLRGVRDERTENQLVIDARMHRWDAVSTTPLRVANRMTYEFGNHKALLTERAVAGLLADAGFVDVVPARLGRSVYFDPVPGTHLARYPDSELEAFVLEARRPVRATRPDREAVPHHEGGSSR
jgi:predicted SAM-dependent methyltransferase